MIIQVHCSFLITDGTAIRTVGRDAVAGSTIASKGQLQLRLRRWLGGADTRYGSSCLPVLERHIVQLHQTRMSVQLFLHSFSACILPISLAKTLGQASSELSIPQLSSRLGTARCHPRYKFLHLWLISQHHPEAL